MRDEKVGIFGRKKFVYARGVSRTHANCRACGAQENKGKYDTKTLAPSRNFGEARTNFGALSQLLRRAFAKILRPPPRHFLHTLITLHGGLAREFQAHFSMLPYGKQPEGSTLLRRVLP